MRRVLKKGLLITEFDLPVRLTGRYNSVTNKLTHSVKGPGCSGSHNRMRYVTGFFYIFFLRAPACVRVCVRVCVRALCVCV